MDINEIKQNFMHPYKVRVENSGKNARRVNIFPRAMTFSSRMNCILFGIENIKFYVMMCSSFSLFLSFACFSLFFFFFGTCICMHILILILVIHNHIIFEGGG